MQPHTAGFLWRLSRASAPFDRLNSRNPHEVTGFFASAWINGCRPLTQTLRRLLLAALETASVVLKVPLDGLNIVLARGKYYVYHRETKATLLKGFVGDREELAKRLAQPDIMAVYNSQRKRDKKHTYREGTLGALIQWFENDCPRYLNLSDVTKEEYTKAFLYLKSEWDSPVDSITQPDLYEIRDVCAKEKWPRFADKMISALSSMFTQAVKRRKMALNPAMGIEKANKPDPNANREWFPEEWEAARAAAPLPILIPLMLARHAGFRGQTIAKTQWRNYLADTSYGRCFRIVARKNNEPIWIPATKELQDFLDGLDRTALCIATRTNGTPWESEKQMQTAVSHFLKDLERDGKVGAGLTLHGVRTTYAAGLARDGADTASVAAALGDRSEVMGTHYTRHVQKEHRVVRAFAGRKNDK